MAEISRIEWTDSTFNPWEGCQKVGPGCDNCYAEARNARFGGGTAVNWGPGAPRRRTSAANWKKPLQWNAKPFVQCASCGWRGDLPEFKRTDPTGFDHSMCPICSCIDWSSARRRVFCASLADVFDNEVPQFWRTALFGLIHDTPNLDWLILTKRIGNAAHMLKEDAPEGIDIGALPNVWIGATVVNQEEADRDIPKLLQAPAAVRFLSIEPMLGPIDVSRYLEPTGITCMDVCPDSRFVDQRKVERFVSNGETIPLCQHCGAAASWTGYDDGIDWVIAGGESGHNARPMHPDWARSLRDQCSAAGVPFLFKQWGEWTPGENVERVRGVVDTAFLWNEEWRIHPLNLATDNGHIDDQPDLYRVGKKAAGRFLDGVEWNGYPEARNG